MAKGSKKIFGKFSWEDSYGNLILGAIIVIILGLLVANFLTKRNQQIGTGEKVSVTPQPTQETQTPQEYKIIAGDSLSAISEKFYQSQEFWPVLAQVNQIANPNLIYVDATLKVPAKNEAETIRNQITTTSYQVREGDTLFSIAEKVYGDGSQWPVLDKANGVGRLPNGNPLIFAGSTLVVPR